LFLLGSSFIKGIGQNTDIIDLEAISQKKIRKFIVARSIDHMPDFSSIHASWNKDIDVTKFNVIEKTFHLKYKLSNVWESYRHTDPIKMWNGQSVRFGLLISKGSNSVKYANDSSTRGIETGQVFFLNLKVIKGLFKIPVAFEIITIDLKGQVVEFSYIDNGKEAGKQTLQFFDDGKDRTIIVHRSYYKGESPFRDDYLYPYFHNRFIKAFHRNMKHLIKDSQLVTLEDKSPPVVN
jgi:hypothetical protein